MRLSHLTALVSLTAILGLGGCVSSPPSQFYQLQSGAPELPEASSGVALLLGPMTVADYLQRETLVQRQADGSLTIDNGMRWAGSLQDDMAQLLVRQLASELRTSRVAVYPDRIGFRPEVQVLLNLVRLDSGPQQPAVLEAQWRLLDGKSEMRNTQMLRLQGEHDGSVSDQVRAQSELLKRLSEQLAMAIRPMMARTPVRGAPKALTQAEPVKPAEETPRVPPPLRTDLEVYRF
ncbi:PqiC family protein [Stutzerimonas tarimensis]|uniref:Membrane integrity-associated transporter subunit PqiC n=1 Tax=Stutzerimonas tarimensis TaxID=1507735 RepID=A0ABV7T608_9GAMM